MTPISDLEGLIIVYRLDCSENLVCDLSMLRSYFWVLMRRFGWKVQDSQL